FVDRAVVPVEAVVGPIEFPACLVAVRLRPAFVLRLQNTAGQGAEPNQGGQPLASVRAVRRQRCAALNDRYGLASQGLANGLVVGHEEAAFAYVALRRRGSGNIGR